MTRVAFGQLALVALTALVGAQSSGFLKPEVGSKFRNILPLASFLQQEQQLEQNPVLNEQAIRQKRQQANLDLKTAINEAVKKKEDQVANLNKQLAIVKADAALKSMRDKADAALKRMKEKMEKRRKKEQEVVQHQEDKVLNLRKQLDNVKADAELRLKVEEMEKRHKVQQNNLKLQMEKYYFEKTKKCAGSAASVLESAKRMVASQRRISEQALSAKQGQEKQLFIKQWQCKRQARARVQRMLQVATPEAKDIKAVAQAEVAICMKVGPEQETAQQAAAQQEAAQQAEEQQAAAAAQQAAATAQQAVEQQAAAAAKKAAATAQQAAAAQQQAGPEQEKESVQQAGPEQEKKQPMAQHRAIAHALTGAQKEATSSSPEKKSYFPSEKELLPPPPAPQYLRLTLSDKAAVKEQTDRSQQMLEHAINAAFEGLFNTGLDNTEQMLEQKQMEEAWEKENQKALQLCEQSTSTEKKVEKRTP